MKLILEETFDLDNVVELNESTNQKTYVIKGTFSTPDKKNRNGRIYASKLWEDNVSRYQAEIQGKTTNTLMEKEHPPRTAVDPWSAVAQIRKLEMREGLVYGEAELLNIPETAVMRELIDKGIKIGVSSRGVGKMKGEIVEEFNLITYDIVSTPSDYNANLNGFNESMILEGVEIDVNEKGQYICTPEGCSLTEAKVTGNDIKKSDKDDEDEIKSDDQGDEDEDKEVADKLAEEKHPEDCKCDECKAKHKENKEEIMTDCDKKASKLAEAFEKLALGGKPSASEVELQELKGKFAEYMGRETLVEDEKVEEGMKVNTQAICDEAKKLSPENQAKVFAFVLSLS